MVLNNPQGKVQVQTDSPDGNLLGNGGVLIGWLLLLIVAPIAVLSALIVYFLFSYIRIKRSAILLFATPILLGVLIFILPSIDLYIQSWGLILEDISVSNIITGLLYQTPISLLVGILGGLGFSTYRWLTRARYKEWKFRKTPWEIWKKKRVIREIENDMNSPSDGMTLGVDIETGEKVIQTYSEASAHTLIIGGSGSGKTETASVRIRDQIKNGDGVIIIDLKGDPELTVKMKNLADRYGRKFQHFTLQDKTLPYTGPAENGPAHYDPIAQGDATRRTDMLLDLREWGADSDYFKKMTQSYLILLFTVLIHNPDPNASTFEDAVTLMDLKTLQKRAAPLAADPRFKDIIASIDALADQRLANVRENLQTNRAQLEIYLHSVAGPWLRLDPAGQNNINLEQVAREGSVVFFTLDSNTYPSYAAALANLIIQDLKTTVGALQLNPINQPVHVFIDEFSAVGSNNIVGLINKARSSKMSITLATQALGDLIANDPTLKDRILGIVSSFIIHRANTADDAKVYAGLAGTKMYNQITARTDASQGLLGGIGTAIGTGSELVQEVEKTRINPTAIQSLKTGEMFYIAASGFDVNKAAEIGPLVRNVQVILEDPSLSTHSAEARTIPLHTPHTQHSPQAQPAHNSGAAVSQNDIDRIKELTNVYPESVTPLSKDDFIEYFHHPEAEQPERTPSPMATQSVRKPARNVPEDWKKEPINYGLLGSIFNDQKILNEQKQRDIADGIIENNLPTTPIPVPVPPTPAPQPPQPVAPNPFNDPPATPSTPAKDEFSF